MKGGGRRHDQRTEETGCEERHCWHSRRSLRSSPCRAHRRTRPRHVAGQGQGVPAGTVVASGLDNPRGLATRKNGDIWVAEAGRERSSMEQHRPRDVLPRRRRRNTCFGTTGAYTRSTTAPQKRVVTGLPSFGDQGTGDSASAPRDIIVNGHHVVGLIGGGGGADERAQLGRRSIPRPGCSARCVKVDPWSGKVTPFADFAAVRDRQQPRQGRHRLRLVRSADASRRLRRRGRGAATTCSASTSRSRSRRWPCSRTRWCRPRRSSSRPRRAG